MTVPSYFDQRSEHQAIWTDKLDFATASFCEVAEREAWVKSFNSFRQLDSLGLSWLIAGADDALMQAKIALRMAAIRSQTKLYDQLPDSLQGHVD